MLLPDIVRRVEAEQLANDPNERRMTSRLFDYWKALRDYNPYPARSAWSFEAVQGLSEYGFCIVLNMDGPGPIYQMVGTKLKEMAGIDLSGKLVVDTPNDTLLAVAGKHYTEVVQSKGPVALESEFSDNEGTVFLFRTIMLPCSEDGQNIESVIGAITFKGKLSIKEKLAQTTSPTAPETIGVAAPRADLLIVAELKQSAGQTIDTRHPTATSKDHLARGLRECQGLALACQSHEQRSRTALYETLERAYQFHFEAISDLDAYNSLCASQDIKTTTRAPFTALVKLIFGKDFDKTRISEYAACLSYAKRLDRKPGTLRELIESTDGGLKGCIKAERFARRGETKAKKDGLASAKDVLRNLEPIAEISAQAGAQEDFLLLLARPHPERSGRLQVLKVLDEKPYVLEPVIKRAAQVATVEAKEAENQD